MYLFAGCLLVTAVLLFWYCRCRKRSVCKKLCRMSEQEKCQTLNEIIQPFGYCYERCGDVCSTTIHPWQRQYGYTKAFDRYAPHIGIVFDCEPVYFDYEGRTWLIEFWKGQYGINTGCEIGLYRADRIIPEELRGITVFSSVPDEEMMDLSVSLDRKGRRLAELRKRHWWLTIFDMGVFSEPWELTVKISITFPDIRMLQAFVQALEKKGYCLADICLCGLTVSFDYDTSSFCRLSAIRRFLMLPAQWMNRINCRLYCRITEPFCSTLDRMLCLYFYLPPVFRRALRCGRCRKRRWSF